MHLSPCCPDHMRGSRTCAFPLQCPRLPICRNIFKTFEAQSARNIFKSGGFDLFNHMALAMVVFRCATHDRGERLEIGNGQQRGPGGGVGCTHMDKDHLGLDRIRNHFPHPHRKRTVCSSWEYKRHQKTLNVPPQW